jgi:hypothetical protein
MKRLRFNGAILYDAIFSNPEDQSAALRGNADRRLVGSAAQLDDRFVAMGSSVCNSALALTATVE